MAAHILWHGRPICRVVGDAIVLYPRRPVSPKIGPKFKSSPNPLLPPPNPLLPRPNPPPPPPHLSTLSHLGVGGDSTAPRTPTSPPPPCLVLLWPTVMGTNGAQCSLGTEGG